MSTEEVIEWISSFFLSLAITTVLFLIVMLIAWGWEISIYGDELVYDTYKEIFKYGGLSIASELMLALFFKFISMVSGDMGM